MGSPEESVPRPDAPGSGPQPSHAVFLSYASQDADAARKICEALRADGARTLAAEALGHQLHRRIAERSGLAVTAVPRGPRSVLRLALSSLCFGLAIGARLPLAPVVLVAVAVAFYIGRGSEGQRRLLVAAIGPFLACVLLLGLYNVARFGSFTNFGQQYQLSGGNNNAMPAEDGD